MTCSQVGGVGFNELYRGDNRGAFNYFMENANRISILTDSSISALTLVVELKPGSDSPYLHLNPARPNFMSSARKILLKIMPSHKKGDFKIMSPNNLLKRGQLKKADEFHNSIEINSIEQVARECDIQKDIYRKSILDYELPLVPICPSILHLENQIADPEQFEEYIQHKLVSRGLNNYKGQLINDLDIVQSFLSVQPRRGYTDIRQYGGTSPDNRSPSKKKGKMESPPPVKPETSPHRLSQQFKPYPGFDWVISPLNVSSPLKLDEDPETKGNYSIIVMEYLDGYSPLSAKMPEINAIFAGNKKMLLDIKHKINLLVSLEVRRLHQLGYYHGDLHTGNIMINTDELYATQDPADSMNTGKAMLIDFGRVLLPKKPKLPKVCKPRLTTDDCVKQEFIFSKYSYELKSIDECVELMAKIQSIGENRKLAICSALGIKDCAGRSLAQIVSDELAKSPLLIGGGHLRHKIDPLLLRQVFINSLRQTDTYEQLHIYLEEHLRTHKLQVRNKTQQKITPRFSSIKWQPITHYAPQNITVMSGGGKTIKRRSVSNHKLQTFKKNRC